VITKILEEFLKNSLLKKKMAAEFLKNFYGISGQKENFIGMNKKLIGTILVSFMLKKVNM